MLDAQAVLERKTWSGDQTDPVKVTGSIAETRWALDEVRREGGTVGLVPTMGYLHDGPPVARWPPPAPRPTS